MRIVLTEFVTLDGVSQGPGSPAEDTSGDFTRGGWLVPYLDKVFVQRTSDWLDLADGLLLGRRTYEAFARDWPQITDPDDPFTRRMNALPKYVVTNTLTEGDLAPDDGAPRRPDPDRRNAEGTAGPGTPDPRQRTTRQRPAVGRPRRHPPAGGRPHGGRFRAAAARPPERPDRPATRPPRGDENGLLLLEYERVGAAPVAEYEGVTAFV